MRDKPLRWSEPELPDVAYGYYGDSERMYCKVYRTRRSKWFFMRSDYHSQGYLLPMWLDGVTNVDEAKAVAQVYYFINGSEIVNAVKEKNKPTSEENDDGQAHEPC